MKNYIYCIILNSILVIGVLGGCGIKSEQQYSKEKTNYFTTALNGEKQYYTEEQTDVKQIKQLSEQFVEAINTVDYTQTEVEDTYSYYAKEVVKEYKEKGILENSKKNLRERQLQMKSDHISVNQVEFYTVEGKKTCDVMVDFDLTITHATKEYIQQRKITIGEPKKWNYIITFIFEDTAWKVKDYIITEAE